MLIIEINLITQKKLPLALLVGQSIITILCAALWLYTKNSLAFYSALLGGAAWILPSLYTTKKLTHLIFPPKRHQTNAMLWQIFLGLEILKIFTATLIFVLGNLFLPLNTLASISTYSCVILLSYFICLIY
jgi:F0F1-type ATP synthase assembly protein I